MNADNTRMKLMTLPESLTVTYPSQDLNESIWQKINQKTKPPGSLGQLERIAAQIAYCQQSLTPEVSRACCLVFAADHGVCAAGVSPYPQEVTAQMVMNFLRGGAAINVFCQQQQVTLKVINAGIKSDLPVDLLPHPDLVQRPVRAGSRNFAVEAALSAAELAQCLTVGTAVIDQFAADAQVVCLGEMGIGNSTTAAAIYAALFGWPPSDVVGAGTGANTAMQAQKTAVINRALARHHLSPDDPLQILCCVGGLEIAMMTAAYLRAAALGKLILVDGFIATSAWAIAHALQPALRSYSLFAHQSGEQGHARVLAALQAEPLLHLRMRLGEGTGAVAALPLVRLATAFFNQMASFADAGVSQV